MDEFDKVLAKIARKKIIKQKINDFLLLVIGGVIGFFIVYPILKAVFGW